MENGRCAESSFISETDDDKDLKPKRERWSHKADGIITLLAFTVGEGTVLKFPYLCARNGGGAFLLPYILFSALCALPLCYIEMLIGQYTQRGPVGVWKLCSAMKGTGVGMVFVSLAYSSYTAAFFSWYAYYLFYSFFPVLPWSTCDNSWNTEHCFTPQPASGNFSNVTDFNVTADPFLNETMTSYLYTNGSGGSQYNDSLKASSAEEFWILNVLNISDSLENVGSLRWPLVGWMTFAFVCMYFILFKGVHVSGKIVYVTFFCPIILLTVLFIRALTLPGATGGLLYYIKPDFHKLKDLRIWLEACMFSLYSMGTGTGGIITAASHNKFRTNIFSQSLILVTGDVLITIYCGFAIFTFLGHMAWVKGVGLEDFESGGFNIAFMVFPEAVTYLPLPQLWAVILFVTFMTLGLDTTVPCFDVVITVLSDKFPRFSRRRWLLVAIVMLPLLLMSMLFVTQGGIYQIILVDWFSFAPCSVIFGIAQTLVIGWVFGARRLDKFAEEMYDKPVPRLLKVFIQFITPVILVVTFCYALYDYRPPKYRNYYFPTWATAIGWMITTIVVLPLPVWMAYSVWKAKGDTFREKVKAAFRVAPVEDADGKANKEQGNSLL